MIIQRDLTNQLLWAAQSWPSITLTGPRQSGKTTLCRHLFSNHSYRLLEAPDVREFATEDPRGFLAQFPAGAVLDEVQRVPDLLSYLQEIIDANPTPGRWILTGSQNLSLLKSVSQSLAGRTAMYNLLPMNRSETIRFSHYPETLEETLYMGSYPRVFNKQLDPLDWNRSYIATYVERDVRLISDINDLATFQRFLALCAGRTGQLINFSSLAGDCGISQPTAKAWLNILETSFVIFRLPAFRSNIRKRLVKNPKLHFYDSGLVCWLLGIHTPEQLIAHPLRGSIFETWVVSEILKRRTNRGESGGLSFFRDQNGAEADLVIEHPNGLSLVEAKSSMTATSSVINSCRRVERILSTTDKVNHAIVVYGGNQLQRRGTTTLVPWCNLHEIGELSAN